MEDQPQIESRKKSAKRSKMRIWLLFDLGITCIFLSLLFYRPFIYSEPQPQKTERVGEHWKKFSSQIYNSAQLARPFEVEISQEQINRMVQDGGWPKESGGISFSAPQVFLRPDRIILMGTAAYDEIKFIVTVSGKPQINQSGQLNLHVTKMKVGALNVTFVARLIAHKSYSQALSNHSIDKTDIRTRIVASLLNDEPFEPVFTVEDKKIRIKDIKILKGNIKIDFVPVVE